MPSKKVNPESIAEKAAELFISRGYSNTSMTAIGESCGIMKGSLYHHFENKEHILLYILKHLQSDLRNYVFSIADNKEKSELQRLREINKFLKKYFLEKKACLIAMLGMESELISKDAQNIMNDIFNDWKKTYIKLFRKYYSPHMAELHATNSIIFIEGAIVWLRVTQDEGPLKRIFNIIERPLLETD